MVQKCIKFHDRVPYSAKMCKTESFGNGTEIQYHMVLTLTKLFGLA